MAPKGSFKSEFVMTSIPTRRVWKAIARDAHNLLPRIMPELIATSELLKGDGGVGSIRKTNFTPDVKEFLYVKHLIEGINEERHIYEYSSIEGGYIGSKLKTCSYKFRFLPTPDSGTLVRMDAEYESLTGEPFPDEDAMKIKELILKVLGAVEAYLLTDPNAYV